MAEGLEANKLILILDIPELFEVSPGLVVVVFVDGGFVFFLNVGGITFAMNYSSLAFIFSVALFLISEVRGELP